MRAAASHRAPPGWGDTYPEYVAAWTDWGVPEGWVLLTEDQWLRRKAKINGYVPWPHRDDKPSLWAGLRIVVLGFLAAVVLVAVMLVLYPMPDQGPPSTLPPQPTAGP